MPTTLPINEEIGLTRSKVVFLTGAIKVFDTGEDEEDAVVLLDTGSIVSFNRN